MTSLWLESVFVPIIQVDVVKMNELGKCLGFFPLKLHGVPRTSADAKLYSRIKVTIRSSRFFTAKYLNQFRYKVGNNVLWWNCFSWEAKEADFLQLHAQLKEKKKCLSRSSPKYSKNKYYPFLDKLCVLLVSNDHKIIIVYE